MRTGWNKTKLKGFTNPNLFNEIKKILSTPPQTKDAGDLGLLLLEVIKESEWALQLKDKLEKIVLTAEMGRYRRQGAIDVLLALNDKSILKEVIEKLLCLKDYHALILTSILFHDIGVDEVTVENIVKHLFVSKRAG